MIRWTAEWASLACLSVVFAIPFGQSGPQEDLDGWWADLSSTDGAKAYRAMGQLAGAAEKAVPFLDKHLRAIAAVPPERVAQLVAKLGDEKFAVRDEAQRELEKLKDLAEKELLKTSAAVPNPEVRLRVKELLEKLDLLKCPERLQALRAIEVLEGIGSPEAKQVLQRLTDGAPEAQQTREAKASLQRLLKKISDLSKTQK